MVFHAECRDVENSIIDKSQFSESADVLIYNNDNTDDN